MMQFRVTGMTEDMTWREFEQKFPASSKAAALEVVEGMRRQGDIIRSLERVIEIPLPEAV